MLTLLVLNRYVIKRCQLSSAECSAMKLQNTWGRNSVIIYVQLIDLAFYVKLNLFINNLILLIINTNNFSPVLLQTALCLFCEEKRALG